MSKGTIPLEIACLGMSPLLHNPRGINWTTQKTSNSESPPVHSLPARFLPIVCSLHSLFPPVRENSKKALSLSDTTLTIGSFEKKWRSLFFSRSIKLFQSHVMGRLPITTNTTLLRHFLFWQLFQTFPVQVRCQPLGFSQPLQWSRDFVTITSLICLLPLDIWHLGGSWCAHVEQILSSTELDEWITRWHPKSWKSVLGLIVLSGQLASTLWEHVRDNWDCKVSDVGQQSYSDSFHE